MNINSVLSTDAYDYLQEWEGAVLIDVRTAEEWGKIGVPQLNKDKICFLSWQLLPSMLLNQEFPNQLIAQYVNKSVDIFFLCRSGGRSLAAGKLAASLGYSNCYNIIDGFEGNSFGKGWKQNNLPWQIL